MLATVHQPLKHNAALAVLAEQLGQLDTQLQEELAYCGVLTLHFEREVELWIGTDQRSRPCKSASSFKVLVVVEPPDVQQPCTDGFDLILTWQASHLKALPQARQFLPATPWLIPTEWPDFHGEGKLCSLGFLRGAKRRTEGHCLRHEVWEKLREAGEGMNIPTAFEPGGGVDRAARNRQFRCQFVLVIENSRHENYFTEKLLDAFLARCVPLYWGCPNISSYFDHRGIIEINGGLAEIVAACQRLTSEDYATRTEAIDRNFNSATEYAGDFGKRVQHAVEPFLGLAEAG